jgi:uncharacterized membrane protein
MIFFVVLISVIPIFVFFTKLIPTKYLPALIFSVSLALVLHQALISQHLWGADINAEYYFYQVTNQNHHWDSNIVPPTYNSGVYSSTTSITLLPVAVSSITGIEGLWVFKAVFPFLYSLVPLILYLIFQKQIGSRPAFLAAFFFAAIPSFYQVDLTEGKQMIATVFIVLFILVLLKEPKRFSGFLLVLFGACAIISHYSSGLFLVVLLLLATPIFWLKHRSYRLPAALAVSIWGFYLLWYTFMSGGSVLNMFGNFINAVYTAIPRFLDADSRFGVALLQSETVWVTQLITYLNVIFQALITLGLIDYFYSKMKKKTNTVFWEFAVFATVSFSFLFLTVALPLFGSYFHMGRLYTLSLLFLAPFGVLGSLACGKILNRVLHLNIHKISLLKALSLFATIFLLFNIGFFSAILNQPYGSAFSIVPDTSYALYNQGEFVGALWLTTYAAPDAHVLMDPASAPVFFSLAYLNILDVMSVIRENTDVTQSGMLFFINTRNIQTDTIQLANTLGSTGTIKVYDVKMSQQCGYFISNSDRIYDNGLSASMLLP